MSQSELLKTVVGELNRLEIPHMLTGSLASSYQGEPRSTHDIDLVVDILESQLGPLIERFPPPRYFVSREAAVDAIQRRRMFNVLEIDTGDKVDLWVLRKTPFDSSRFARRQRAIILGVAVDVSSPEDTIVMKLKWAADMGGSEKQFHDALSVFEVQETLLDRQYIERWTSELGLTESWTRLINEATQDEG
jgi:hypothetical protein